MANLSERLANSTARAIEKHRPIPLSDQSDEYKSIVFGATVAYGTIIKTLCLFAICLLTHILKLPVRVSPNIIIVMASCTLLKLSSFGIHMDNSIKCTLLGFFYYIGSTLLADYTTLPPLVYALLWLFTFGVVLRYAPAETRKRRIPPCQQKNFKIRSIFVTCVGGLIALILSLFQLHQHASTVILGMFCQSLNLLPVMYILFKQNQPPTERSTS